MIPLLALLACLNPVRGQTPTDTWLGATGNWSLPGGWLGGTAPPAGGGPGRILEFSSNFAVYTATNNLGAPFQLNGLRFDGSGSTGYTITIANAAGGSLQLAGTNPFILQNTDANVVISAAAALTTNTAIGGTGYGTLTLSGLLSGGVAAGSDALTFNGSGVLPAVAGIPLGSLVTVSGSNNFTGNIELGNANLSLGSNTALGASANPLIVNAGSNSLRFGAAALNIVNPITINGTLTMAGSNAGTLSGAIGGTGGMTVSGGGMVTLTAANTFGGVTTTGVPGGGTNGLTLSGAGALTGTSSIVLGAGGTLALVNTATANSTNRIADAASLTFQNGALSFTAAPAVNAISGETFGPVTVQGAGTIAVTATSQSGTSSVLQFGALSQIANGTLFVQNAGSTSQMVGGGVAGPNRTNIFFSGGLPTLADPVGGTGGQNTAIVPFLSGSLSGTANVMGTLATYDANGVRLLSPTDATVFAQPSSSLVAHANNNLSGSSYSVSGTTTVTSLVATYSYGSAISGSGTLQVASGAVVAAAPLTISGTTLAFGTTTGYLALGSNLNISYGSAIAGSGGVVVSSANSSALVLTSGSSNPFTGGLYVNGNASVDFSADAQLGAAGQSVTLNGGTLVGSAGTTTNRTINLGPGGGSVGGSAATYAGTVTGAGGLTIAANANVTLTGTNSYTGPTTVNGNVTLAGSNTGGGATIINQGTLSFTSASNFSSGPIILNGGTMESLVSGTFARDVIAASSSTFSVASGQTLTYTGNLSGGGSLSVGSGTLILATANTAITGVSANGGTVVLSGPTSLQTATVTAGAGSLVRLNDTDGGARLGPNTPVSVQAGGEFEMDGGTVPMAENFGALSNSGTVTIIPGSGATASLNAASLGVGTLQPPALFRGTNLGGTAAGSAQIYAANLSVGTVILNALADTSATGTGQDQAVYGTAGIRPAVAGDFTSGPVLQNASPTNTPFLANFRVSGAVTTAGSSNTVNSLRLEPGGTLTIASGTLDAGSQIYAAAGGASTIAGPGTLKVSFEVLTMGDLNISAPMANESLYKFGPGTLTVSGPASFSSLNVGVGTVVLNSGQTVPASFATINSNLVLGTSATVLHVTGAWFEYPTTVISGPGSIIADSTQFAYGASTYSGGTTGGPNAEFVVYQPSALGTGPVTLANTNGTTNPTPLLEFLFGAGTFANDVNLPTTNSSTELLNFGPGAVTLSGAFHGGNAAAGTAVQFSGSTILTNPNNDFTATVVAGIGDTLAITSNSVLGNAANAIQLNSGTLRFNAAAIVVPRAISVSTFGGTLDTGIYQAQVSGVISGSGSVNKQGTGTLNLSGPNTFTGDLMLYAGTTLVTGSLAAETTGYYGVFVQTGATFGGTGTVNRTLTGFGGTIAPGLPTATGILTVGNLSTISRAHSPSESTARRPETAPA